ncbi:hypothetical protein C7212DRAFT_363210 [Tuber magnatum]|uniref:ABC transporter domain-containing protein n=1 Tax=Tuber magnatum TaxID=42249 RepID=A0A317SRC7_9PEZI|nr:hypothetical protein C7212DRAFT_363210 [Tuber magnatum]
MSNFQITYPPRPPLLQNFSKSIRASQRPGALWSQRIGEGRIDIPPNLQSPAHLFPTNNTYWPPNPPSTAWYHKLGVSVFDVQGEIGHASPEVHVFFPKAYSLRHTVHSALTETFHAKPPATKYTETLLVEFEDMVACMGGWDNAIFGEAGFSVQRLALFLRAVVCKRDLIVLGEASSGMDSVVRDRCLPVLANGLYHTRQALVVVGHVSEEAPEVDMWVRMPESWSDSCAVFGDA